MGWQPRSPEDRLLLAYWQREGGRIYAEVPIGGPGAPGGWLPGCTTRRIDGVRFPGAAGGESCIWRFGQRAAEFARELAAGGPVEVIEVKASLNRTAIGQAIAGVDMFGRQYGRPAQGVILCGSGDSALEWVCDQRSIKVEKLDFAPLAGVPEQVTTADRPRE
jgi:hypothetical protein